METCLTIYVTFEGLGFCCFNPQRQGAEIAFLRLADHNLKIKITGSDGRSEVINNITDHAKIELMSEETTVKGFQLNDDGTFNRREGLDSRNDPFDLRWIMDFESEELHGRKALPRVKPEPLEQTTNTVRGLTAMFLPNAYFFTEQILSSDYEIEQVDTGTRNVEKKPFGLIGDTLGARIDAVEAALRIDGKNIFEFGEGVNAKEVTRFFVTITNVCEEPAPLPQSDFHKYYEVLDFKDGKKFDFDIPGMQLLGERPAICEFTWLSQTESLAGFFEKSSAATTKTGLE